MLKRFDSAVVAAKPDLVLWQLGTNSVIRDHKLADHGASIRDGLNKIRAIGADVVLIDPQFAPKVIAKPEAAHMVELIATTAKQEDVDLFRRFDVMKRWREVDHMAFETFVSPDGLHMNDWSYACMAKGLGLAIAEAAERPVHVGGHVVPGAVSFFGSSTRAEFQSSWPGLSRPSTSYFAARTKAVDARHRAGHDDEILLTPYPTPSADPRSGRRGARGRPRTAPAHRRCRVRRAAPA